MSELPLCHCSEVPSGTPCPRCIAPTLTHLAITERGLELGLSRRIMPGDRQPDVAALAATGGMLEDHTVTGTALAELRDLHEGHAGTAYGAELCEQCRSMVGA